MKIVRDLSKAIVTKKGENSILNGHPWVFEGEIKDISNEYINGDLVDVVNEKGKYLGTGFINDNSKIRIRIVTRNINDTIDSNFWKRRVTYAYNYRLQVMNKEDYKCMRIIFGEADGFPGLTVDRFNDILVCEVLSLGIEKNKDMIFSSLLDVLTENGEEINAIYERNDSLIRKKEGLDLYKGYYFKNECIQLNYTIIEENGIKYKVDYENGQKTGFFLDQKQNRLAIRNISNGKRVLDCCTHTGSFSFNAIMGGAIESTALDISEEALNITRENSKLNNMENKMKYVNADLFDYLRNIEKGKFDFIILDPPAFTKSRKTLNNALKGYKEINKLAMKALKRGDFLATASCSSFATPELFISMLKDASKEAGVGLKLVEEKRQSSDHPILLGVKETEYLKFYIFQII